MIKHQTYPNISILHLTSTVSPLGCVCYTELSRTGLAPGTKLDWLRLD